MSGDAAVQRLLTTQFIVKHRLNAPAVFFRPHGDTPSAQDEIADKLDIDIEGWDSTNDNNLGVRLEGGYLELNIKAGDDAFAHAFFLAADHLKVDARAAFGVERIHAVILKVEDHETIARQLWPRGTEDKRRPLDQGDQHPRASTPPPRRSKRGSRGSPGPCQDRAAHA